MKYDWDVTPAILQLCVFCASPGVRAEFDKIEIKEHVSRKTLLAALARGDASQTEGKLTEAAAAYREAARLIPEEREAHDKLIALLGKTGDVEGLLAAIREKAQMTNDRGDGYAILAGHLRRLGRLDEAEAAARESARICPYSDASWGGLVSILSQRRDYDGAAAAFREGIRLVPDSILMYNDMAWALVMKPGRRAVDIQNALGYARKAYALAPDNGAILSTLGAAEYYAGDLAKADAILEVAQKLRNGGDPYEWFIRAMIRHRNGDQDQGRIWFDKSVAWTREKRPNDPELHLLWTQAAEVLGRPRPEPLATRETPGL